MRRFIGLMSGTSLDGVDAALLAVEGTPPDGVLWRLEAFRSDAFEERRRTRILAALTAGTPATLTRLHAELGEWFAETVRALLHDGGLGAADVTAIGSHGQTIWHRPPTTDCRGATLQLGDAATLAAGTGIDVVADFRSADVAAGGHGAPLVPWPDRVLLAHVDRARIVLNVGGMANLTWLPPRGGDDGVIAFDTGPGNVLIDEAARLASEGAQRFDRDGAGAAAGTVRQDLLAQLMADPWFDRAPPRSTGREHFGPPLVEALSGRIGLEVGVGERWPDLLATLTAFTAATVADAVARHVVPREVDEVVVAGGGAHNPTLVGALATALAERGVGAPVRIGAEALGIDPDAREAAAFALLAWAHLERHPGNLPSATGASGPRVLGSFTPAPGASASDTPTLGGVAK